MEKNPIMAFTINIKSEEITSFQSPAGGAVCFIPFGGSVSSGIFTGTIRPGACDVQVTNPAGCRSMCASYIFEGTDCDGTPCCLYVKNQAWFMPGAEKTGSFQAVPTFITDSPKLAPYLHAARFRSEGQSVDKHTLLIKIFDIWD